MIKKVKSVTIKKSTLIIKDHKNIHKKIHKNKYKNHINNNNNNAIGRNNSIYKQKLTKKKRSVNINNTNGGGGERIVSGTNLTKEYQLVGGHALDTGNNQNKEDFEITSLVNTNYSKFSLSKYINANVVWGSLPGPPPTDCVIC